MAVDERSRHELYTRLEQAVGSTSAMTLMEYLPPVGWADVATKHDLAQLEARLDLRLEATEHRIMAVMRAEMVSQTRTFVFATIGSLATLASLAVAAIRLG